ACCAARSCSSTTVRLCRRAASVARTAASSAIPASTCPVWHRAGHAGGMRVNRAVCIPDAELMWRFSRSSGPGGQSVNTADSRVELRFDVARSTALPPHLKARALERLAGRLNDGVITVTASEHRAQLHNRRAAAARLAALLAEAVAPPRRA